MKSALASLCAVIAAMAALGGCTPASQTLQPGPVDHQPVNPPLVAAANSNEKQSDAALTVSRITGFVYDSFDGIPNIYYMKERSQDRVCLAPCAGGNFQAAWSPDGSKIAFVSSRDGEYQIYTMDLDGSNVSRLTSLPLGAQCPSWSPDGKKIAFVAQYSWPDPNYSNSTYASNAIYVMNPDGTNMVNVTGGKEEFADSLVFSPAWSPDGKRLVFLSLKVGTKYASPRVVEYFAEKYPDIFVIGADGAGLEALTRTEPPTDWGTADKSFASLSAKSSTLDTPHDSYICPTWSPDGKTIAFLANRENGGGMNDYWQIYTMTDSGKNQKKLGEINIIGWCGISRNYPSSFMFASRLNGYGASFLHWSRDGRYIAASSLAIQQDSTRDYQAAVIDARNGEIVFKQKAARNTFCWSPDSKRIAFVPWSQSENPRTSACNLVVMNYDGTESQTLYDVYPESSLNWRP